ncbi:YciI family protein [Phycicoccus ginsengisoli]
MRYVVLLAYRPGEWEDASEQVRQEYFDAHHDFERFVDERGRRVAGAALADADLATTVRHREDGTVAVTDGPFVELTEQVGGYYEVELPDLDTAIAAARLLPRVYAVELRPTVPVEGYEGT